MENKDIVKIIKKTAELMELHEENAFKVRSFQNAIFKLERLEQSLANLSSAELEKIDGIGKSLALVIAQIIESGSHPALDNLLEQTPQGVLDMLSIKGVGPKKIRLLWKELEIDNLDDLLQACEDNKVAKVKGFGEKTQENIKEAILFKASVSGQLHYAEAEELVDEIDELLKAAGVKKWSSTGDFQMKREVITQLNWLIADIDASTIEQKIADEEIIEWDEQNSGPRTLRGKFRSKPIPVEFRFCDQVEFGSLLLTKSASPQHLGFQTEDNKTLQEIATKEPFATEEEIYKKVNWPYIAPEMREGLAETEYIKSGHTPKLLEVSDLKGILHNHSTYSDGKHSLREMASYCKELGYEYLGISDHSRSAFYAQGLEEEAIIKQHKEIDELNAELKPFKVFKGIESDILNDGALDYPTNVLASFDFIVASIHSNLNMDSKKATERLIRAIANPYTTMLGHPTGRLLLRREGYPIDHKAVIDACAHYGVIIEINANPWRLDLDWRWVHYALEKNVMLSINPDAHEKAGYEHMKYGVYVGRKGGLTKNMTFNAKSLAEVEKHFADRLKKASK
ncbi:DNA polymerase/3'-5' exonuclease PolX [Peijinzhouia sedimentorum]